MDAAELRALQAPIKDKYKTAPEAAVITLKANGSLDEGIACKVETGRALQIAEEHHEWCNDQSNSEGEHRLHHDGKRYEKNFDV